MKSAPRRIGPIIRKLYAARNQLRKAFPKLSFTLDGNLVGDIGEAIAAADYQLNPLPKGTKRHDFMHPNGTKVQVKATQQTKGNVGLGRDKQRFEHLVVFQIRENGTYSVLFDAPGRYINKAWKGKKTASLSVLQLKALNAEVRPKERILR
jgi:hypothetical protein